MAQDGDYPLMVYVWNRFDKASNIVLDVTFNHWFNGNRSQGTANVPDNSNIYSIQPGDVVGFPLYWSDESLTMTFDPAASAGISSEYYIWLGPKCNYDLTDQNGHSLIGNPDCRYIQSGLGGSNSGLCKILNSELNWRLTVGKLIPDPETDHVSVGPDIP